MVVVGADDGDARRRVESDAGYVIVRLKPQVAERVLGDLYSARSDSKLQQLIALLDEFGIKYSRPLVRSVKRELILEWESLAAKTKFPPQHSLLEYWRLDFGERPERMPELVERLLGLPVVDEAYVDGGAVPAAV